MTLAYFDLDDFKLINDSLGHLVGDAVLLSTAQRIRETLRHTDTGSRQGGDEFVILLPEIDAVVTQDRVRHREMEIDVRNDDLDEIVLAATTARQLRAGPGSQVQLAGTAAPRPMMCRMRPPVRQNAWFIPEAP